MTEDVSQGRGTENERLDAVLHRVGIEVKQRNCFVGFMNRRVITEQGVRIIVSNVFIVGGRDGSLMGVSEGCNGLIEPSGFMVRIGGRGG